MAAKGARVKKKPWKAGPKEWVLRLYVAGTTAKAIAALSNLKAICEEHLKGRYSIQVIDLLRNPQLAEGDQILATPTLVRALPTPIKRIIGNLASSDRVLVGLDLRPAADLGVSS
jgi:circadian clock protein KaiB